MIISSDDFTPAAKVPWVAIRYFRVLYVCFIGLSKLSANIYIMIILKQGMNLSWYNYPAKFDDILFLSPYISTTAIINVFLLKMQPLNYPIVFITVVLM